MGKRKKESLHNNYSEYLNRGGKYMTFETWCRQIGASKYKKIKVKQWRAAKSWKQINDEMKEFQKTDRFRVWRKNQFLRQGGTCYYCHQPLRGVRQNIEHIIPKSKGGDNRFSNLVIACSKCNREKNTKILNRSEKQQLFAVNRKKRGTYHLIRDSLLTEEEFGFELKQMLREG